MKTQRRVEPDGHAVARDEFLAMIVQHVAKHPEDGAYVAEAVAEGIYRALRSANQRAADMEVCLAVTLARRYPKRLKIVLDKLSTWAGQSALNWTSTVAELQKEVKRGSRKS